MSTFESDHIHVIMFLWPALLGFTNEGKEGKEYRDSKSLSQKLDPYTEGDKEGAIPSETKLRVIGRHHYMKRLQGCYRPSLIRFQKSFHRLYSFLTKMIHPEQ